MSKGPGKVQRALAVIFKAEPNKLFGTDELARVYLGEPVTETRRACIREALAKIGPALGVKLYGQDGRSHLAGVMSTAANLKPRLYENNFIQIQTYSVSVNCDKKETGPARPVLLRQIVQVEENKLSAIYIAQLAIDCNWRGSRMTENTPQILIQNTANTRQTRH